MLGVRYTPGVLAPRTRLMLLTYQSDDGGDGTVNVDMIVTKYRDETVTGSDRGDLNICGVITHDLSQFLKPLSQDPIKFTGMDVYISRQEVVCLASQITINMYCYMDLPFEQPCP